MALSYKPSDVQNVIPYLVVPDADGELKFLKDVFGAKDVHVTRDENGRIRHAQVTIGDSAIMLAESSNLWPAQPASVYVYVADVDAAYARALRAGATSTMEPEDKPYGDRNGGVQDANGVQWWMGTRVEDLSWEEIDRRTADFARKDADVAK